MLSIHYKCLFSHMILSQEIRSVSESLTFGGLRLHSQGSNSRTLIRDGVIFTTLPQLLMVKIIYYFQRSFDLKQILRILNIWQRQILIYGALQQIFLESCGALLIDRKIKYQSMFIEYFFSIQLRTDRMRSFPPCRIFLIIIQFSSDFLLTFILHIYMQMTNNGKVA